MPLNKACYYQIMSDLTIMSTDRLLMPVHTELTHACFQNLIYLKMMPLNKAYYDLIMRNLTVAVAKKYSC